MLPWASFNCEYFDFSTSFPRKFTKPASISSELFKPFHKCAFLVRLNVSRLNVRFSKVISFPSRKQVQGFDVCPKAQLRKWCWAAVLHGQSWLAELASAARAGAVYHEGRSEVGSCHPEELCLWKGRGLRHFLLFRGVLFCKHQVYLLCWLLETQATELLAQVTLQGLVNLKKIKNAKREVTQTSQ